MELVIKLVIIWIKRSLPTFIFKIHKVKQQFILSRNSMYINTFLFYPLQINKIPKLFIAGFNLTGLNFKEFKDSLYKPKKSSATVR